jgi:hypothetical protein
VSFKSYSEQNNEDSNLEDILSPPQFLFKYIAVLFGGLTFILSGFFWLPWYMPIIALILHYLVIPIFVKPMTTGAKSGHKDVLLRGLRSKIRTSSKSGDKESVDAYNSIYNALQASSWRVRPF